jgi:hypothetical protein
MKRMMKSGNYNPLRSLAGACFLLVMFSMPAAFAQQARAIHPAANSAAPAAKPVTAEEQETTTPNKAGAQGIKIHGHWVIDLKNPDGTVVEHRDFYNSLVTSSGWSGYFGSSLITGLLSGTMSMGGFGVALITGPATTSGYDASTFCQGVGVAPQGAPHGIFCYGMTTGTNSPISYPSNQNGGQTQNTTQPVLTASFVATPGVNVPANTGIVLVGNFVVPANMGAVSAVQTYVAFCGPTTNPSATSFNTANIPSSSCNVSGLTSFPQASASTSPFTSTTISPLTVTAGQVLAVSVTLTFS